jgi:hypothetical protein
MLFVRDFNFENATNTYHIAQNSKFYCSMPENWVFKKTSDLGGGFSSSYFSKMPENWIIDVGFFENTNTYVNANSMFQGASSPSIIKKLIINGDRM